MIDEHGNEFDERNLFLHLTLGLTSASQRLDALLEKYGHRPTIDAKKGASVATQSPEDAALVEFVLGLVSFRNHVIKAVEHARTAPRKTHVSRPEPADSGAEHLLR